MKTCLGCGEEIPYRTHRGPKNYAERKFCSVKCRAANQPRRPLSERLWSRVDTSGDCWVWMGATIRNGYGVIGLPGRNAGNILTHVAAYLECVGPIPDGFQIDHLCRNTTCCRPDHLEAVTQLENIRRQAAAKTHCINGHEFTPENTYHPPAKPHWRQCRTCTHDRAQRPA